MKSTIIANPLVSIVVVNWNTLEITKKCIESIEKNVIVPYEVILVDNGSTDGSAKYFKESNHKNTTVIFNDSNQGYAGGNNVGIKMAKGKYICLLNSDAFVTKGSIELMIRHMEKTDASLVGPLTNKAKGLQSKRVFIKPFRKLLPSNQEVEYLSFFCILIKSEVFKKIGLLDESFGLGTFEDDDFCKRAKHNSFKLNIAQHAWVWHEAHATMKANNISENDLIMTNKYKFEDKWKTQ
ncbi:glycosyltransferase family 2 protein [Mariniphaga sediminis]|uniref:Glycosyltransferase family 2 protein n=1 Tax=Mariniphaga sediminis TaxID=1628158 RepID=A0A399CTK2_9BACT|nr:glycosyltransferase family 2 protein [Mariniphaga sediminis]RIH63244.1 glycosyltransferase family 2 protein [Mariniphaga sediminis]